MTSSKASWWFSSPPEIDHGDPNHHCTMDDKRYRIGQYRWSIPASWWPRSMIGSRVDWHAVGDSTIEIYHSSSRKEIIFALFFPPPWTDVSIVLRVHLDFPRDVLLELNYHWTMGLFFECFLDSDDDDDDDRSSSPCEYQSIWHLVTSTISICSASLFSHRSACHVVVNDRPFVFLPGINQQQQTSSKYLTSNGNVTWQLFFWALRWKRQVWLISMGKIFISHPSLKCKVSRFIRTKKRDNGNARIEVFGGNQWDIGEFLSFQEKIITTFSRHCCLHFRHGMPFIHSSSIDLGRFFCQSLSVNDIHRL